jgi:pimeloyl-ACP methyl ester carboxylesterase
MPVAFHLYYFANEADNFLRPPVILIHGAGGHHLYWPPQIRRLHDQRVFAVDLSGHGKSGGIGYHTIEDYAGEVIEFMASLGLNSAVLVGHTMGGAIALEAGTRFPSRLLGLCLVGSGAKLPVAPEILRNTSDPSTFSAAIGLIRHLSFADETSPRLRELAAQRMAETRPSVLHGDFLACSAFDATGQLSQVAVPTLILCGAEDRMTPPRFSEFLHKNIVGAQLEIIARAGHMVMLEQPDLVADKLARFLNTISYRPGA